MILPFRLAVSGCGQREVTEDITGLPISAPSGTTEYPRIRIGIGNSFSKGAQIDYVLGKWDR